MSLEYDSMRYASVNQLDDHHPRAVERAFPDLHGRRVLEVGCGRGHLLQILQEAGADAVGIDTNPQAIATGVTSGMAVGDAERLAYPDRSFDAVVSVHAIEHLEDLDGALEEMVRVLRPGGRMLLIYPAEPIRGLWAIPTAVILHGTPFKAREVHRQRLTPSRLQRRLAHLPLTHAWSRFSWRGWPQYASVFDRLPARDASTPS
jgi:ubiquinone/menaquinone biosynthesis C-methylase UbiE